jgi:hypothetical protein
MNPDELKRAASVSAIVSIGVSALYIWLTGVQLLSVDAVRGFGVSLSVVSLFWLVYLRWAWRWPITSRLFDRPDLGGTWIGELTTDWRGPDGNTVGPRKLVLVVRQTLLYLHVTSFTDSFIGISYAETLKVSRERGLRKLVYLYARDSTAIGESWNREGVSELLVQGDPSAKMDGHYWTNTKTQGRIAVVRVSTTCSESFEQALELERKRAR